MRALLVCIVAALALTATPAAAVPVSGHRGTFRNSAAPENTMSAFRYAKGHGAAIIEFDVRWTKDQRKYILHDDRLGRTTNGTGRLEDHSARYIRGLTVDGGERIPSFREVTAYAKTAGLQINAEVKPTDYPFTDAQARSYVAIVYLYGMQNRTVVSSISPAVLNRIKRFDVRKALRYSLIQSGPLHSPDVVAAMGKVYMPLYTSLTPGYVAALHARGVKIWAWPIRNDTDRSAALALKVDVLVEDDPALGAT